MPDVLEKVFKEVEKRIEKETFKESSNEDKQLKINIPAVIATCL